MGTARAAFSSCFAVSSCTGNRWFFFFACTKCELAACFAPEAVAIRPRHSTQNKVLRGEPHVFPAGPLHVCTRLSSTVRMLPFIQSRSDQQSLTGKCSQFHFESFNYCSKMNQIEQCGTFPRVLLVNRIVKRDETYKNSERRSPGVVRGIPRNAAFVLELFAHLNINNLEF